MKFLEGYVTIGKKAILADLHLGLVNFYDSFLVERLKNIAEKFNTVVIAGDIRHLSKKSKWVKTLSEIKEITELIVVKGNHDIDVEGIKGLRIGKYGIFHGHAIPSDEVMQARHLIFGHAHPSVFIQDDVGGYKERVFLIGEIEDRKVTVLPAFNDLCASTAVNLEKPAGFMFRRYDYKKWYAMLLDGTLISLESLIPV